MQLYSRGIFGIWMQLYSREISKGFFENLVIANYSSVVNVHFPS